MGVRRNPISSAELWCDRCGQPALWRNRVVSSCCSLGEALCDTCEQSSRHTQWWNQDNNYWRELGQDMVWLLLQGIAVLGQLLRLVRVFVGKPRHKPDQPAPRQPSCKS